MKRWTWPLHSSPVSIDGHVVSSNVQSLTLSKLNCPTVKITSCIRKWKYKNTIKMQCNHGNSESSQVMGRFHLLIFHNWEQWWSQPVVSLMQTCWQPSGHSDIPRTKERTCLRVRCSTNVRGPHHSGLGLQVCWTSPCIRSPSGSTGDVTPSRLLD